MYKLRYDEQVRAVWDSLPAEASEELTLALADVCRDPYATTSPHSESGDVKRLLVLTHTRAVLVVFKQPQRIRILDLQHLG